MIPEFTYIRAKSLKDVFPHLTGVGARIHAGGTDLLGCIRENIYNVKSVVSISSLNDLKGIKQTDKGLRIGSLVTLAEIAQSPVVVDQYPALAQGAMLAASPQIRNQGTLGGNLCQKPRCWYYRGEFHCLRKGRGPLLRGIGRKIISTAFWVGRNVTSSILPTQLLLSSHMEQRFILKD